MSNRAVVVESASAPDDDAQASSLPAGGSISQLEIELRERTDYLLRRNAIIQAMGDVFASSTDQHLVEHQVSVLQNAQPACEEYFEDREALCPIGGVGCAAGLYDCRLCGQQSRGICGRRGSRTEIGGLLCVFCAQPALFASPECVRHSFDRVGLNLAFVLFVLAGNAISIGKNVENSEQQCFAKCTPGGNTACASGR